MIRRGLTAALALSALLLACHGGVDPTPRDADEDARLMQLRQRMVDEQIEARGIRDRRVLAAMRRVPRHVYAPSVPDEEAYSDNAKPIGHRQTISQPFIVALMTELAALSPDARVLEIGTGSGYQAAVLAEIAAEVYTIEIVEALALQAQATLAAQGYENVRVRSGDGYAGWPEAAPFDAILVTAGAPRVPPLLLDQLAVGGRLVIPVDQPEADWNFLGAAQQLEVHVRTTKGIERELNLPVRFVPMTGQIRDD